MALVVLTRRYYVLHTNAARLIRVNYGARIAEVVSKLIRKSIAEDRDSESSPPSPSFSYSLSLHFSASLRISSRVVFRSQLSQEEERAYYGRIERHAEGTSASIS